MACVIEVKFRVPHKGLLVIRETLGWRTVVRTYCEHGGT